METITTHRNIVYRLLPETESRAKKLVSLSNACRFVWNQVLDDHDQFYNAARMFCATKMPRVAFFDLCKSFKQLRDSTPWLQDYSYQIVRYSLKYQADAWQNFFRGGGKPRFKGKHAPISFTIPQNVRVKDDKLAIEKLGWFRIRGNNPYPNGVPKKVVIKKEGRKWYAVICYEVEIPKTDNGKIVGVDMNAGEVATSEGQIFKAPDVSILQARRKRYQRKMARQKLGSNRRNRTKEKYAKTRRKIAKKLHNWQHHVSRKLANSTIGVEDLKIKKMTRKGKRGINRGIMDTGWANLTAMLDYKSFRLIKVNPAYTSQICNKCGHRSKKSRISTKQFKCVACGHAEHADINASVNIRRLVLAQLHGEGRPRLETPMTREMDRVPV